MSLSSRIKGAWAGLRGKTAPSVGYGGISNGYFGIGSSVPNPTKVELIQQLRESVFACAMLNASAVASVPLKLYAITSKGQSPPKCTCRLITPDTLVRLKAIPSIGPKLKEGPVVEVEEHPLLDLLEQGNELMDGFTLRELTQLYQEVEGNSYWYLEPGVLGVPKGLWVLPSHLMSTLRGLNGLPTAYLYGAGVQKSQYKLDEIVAFRMPCLSDPYGDGYSPLRAIWESAMLAVDNSAYTRAGIDDRGWLNTLVTPKEAIGADEADRMRGKIKKMMMLGKQGGPMVSEQAFDIKQLLSQIDTLAVYGITKETLANAYGVPLALLTANTNLANLAAAREQHGLYGVLPRCRRYEALLNKKLVPLYDERLFLAFDNPVPEDLKSKSTIRESNLRMGVTTINEERKNDNLPPVEWGNVPYKPISKAPGQPGAEPDEDGNKPEDKPKKPKPSPVPGKGTDDAS